MEFKGRRLIPGYVAATGTLTLRELEDWLRGQVRPEDALDQYKKSIRTAPLPSLDEQVRVGRCAIADRAITMAARGGYIHIDSATNQVTLTRKGRKYAERHPAPKQRFATLKGSIAHDKLLKEIHAKLADLVQSEKTDLQTAHEIGDLLIKLKPTVIHGKWEEFLLAEFGSHSSRRLREFKQIAEDRPELENGGAAVSSIREAVRLSRQKRKMRAIEVRDRVQAGEDPANIAEDLGIDAEKLKRIAGKLIPGKRRPPKRTADFEAKARKVEAEIYPGGRIGTRAPASIVGAPAADGSSMHPEPAQEEANAPGPVAETPEPVQEVEVIATSLVEETPASEESDAPAEPMEADWLQQRAQEMEILAVHLQANLHAAPRVRSRALIREFRVAATRLMESLFEIRRKLPS